MDVTTAMADGDAGADATGLVLGVVLGPRAGARHPLLPGDMLRIGYGLTNDVVIRHRSLRGVQVRVGIEPRGIRLQVVEGQVTLFGLALDAGREVLLPQLVPFALGDAMIAVGPESARGWKECRRLARRLAAGDADAAASANASGAAGLAESDPFAGGSQAAADDIAAAGEPVAAGASTASGVAHALVERWRTLRPGARRRLPTWWRMPVALVAILLVPLALAAVIARLPLDARAHAARPEQLDSLRRLLDTEGFQALSVQPLQEGGPVIRGLVETDGDRARVAALVARVHPPAHIEIASGEQLARLVSDVFRLNGVRAEVRNAGRGMVEATVSAADPAVLQRLETEIRRDVPGLRALKLETIGEPRRPAPPPVRDDPRKRVVSVVYGPAGYVVTTDGARYFAGAILPTGHRIERITQDEVVLERNGERTRLVL